MTATHTQPTGHELVQNIIYGPVSSRRYGTTFGINLLPTGEKICSFNCIYCQLGWTEKHKPDLQDKLPTSLQIEKEITSLLEKTHVQKISLVFSGNGEPTMHPQFADIVSQVVSLRNKLRPGTPIICFTNGSLLHHNNIFLALDMLDECCLKLDPAFSHTNLPEQDFSLDRVLKAASQLHNLIIQSCIFSGDSGNDTIESIETWLKYFQNIQPKRVDLYTISRKTPQRGLAAVSQDRLEKIKAQLSQIVSCPVTISV